MWEVIAIVGMMVKVRLLVNRFNILGNIIVCIVIIVIVITITTNITTLTIVTFQGFESFAFGRAVSASPAASAWQCTAPLCPVAHSMSTLRTSSAPSVSMIKSRKSRAS